ncbi:MAG: glutamate-5-semialdehyde dehydrogenase [Candidatus Azotimanducaceae bacterium]|jgi:glutamate-5-semialdehyde dehydrogenase|tara:strand:- start:11282 stop:12547 length:1266 start_codon:yes stop_codon:yes gene_type:complete
MTIDQDIRRIGEGAKAAASAARKASTADKNTALGLIAKAIKASAESLLRANAQDLDRAQAAGLDAPSLDRLTLTNDGIVVMSEGLLQIQTLQDPVGQISQMSVRPNGLEIGKMRTPIGVIGIIYESRPNVTIDAAGLCIKSGNAAILRGGSECISTNRALFGCIQKGLEDAGLDSNWIQLVQTTDREAVGALLGLNDLVDLIIPRGGKGLIERVSRETRIPVLKHLDGNCHVFVHEDADLAMAQSLVVNAKTQRYSVCNALETLLLHRALPASFLDQLMSALRAKGVEVRACEDTRARLAAPEEVNLANESDWSTEYLAPILAVKTCRDLDEAILHINHYGSNHTDVIVTAGLSASQQFLREVDSSSVMVNASPRFADGFEYGLGAEIGISTDKLHARGPVGLEGLTSEKFVVLGAGHIRQ